ncbi:hypothetical protein CHLRE_03g207650v5 [Chlamydomonas reinhardtii]|uniref:HMA domain-containing protein n=1 Tax=Chlamydomonas reinhardtii TaxID=3055 RepID=A0A2K3DYX2_CHLRE|nr:uncharacterized protein CHLRE_03g207650v5 [Chlamydomonas reinhardtii]PNW85733.1 hypothetical protein CHLRE_03g207650v5 [Chlamydomonas reinhardtii]
MAVSLLGGLGASSCCVLQLALNAVGLGCAGFAVLTPYEPIFKGITLAALAHLLLRDGFSNRRALLTTALSLGLLFSQDAVRFYNRGGLTPLAGLLQVPLSRPTNKHPAAVRPQPSGLEDMPDTRRQSDQGASHQRNPAAAPPSTPSSGAWPVAADVSTAAGQPACRSGMCAETRTSGGPRSHTQQQMLDEDEYDDGDELEPPQGASAAVDAETATEAEVAALPGTGELYLRLRVQGIKCEGCAARLRAAVLQLPGVRRCVVDFASKAVLLWGEAGQLGEQGEAARAAIQHMDLSYRVALEESRRL